MNGPHDKFDFVPDMNRLSSSEEGHVRRVEEDQVLEYREEEVREQAHKRLWTLFQQTASALTQLYRDQGTGQREGGPGLAWMPFQTAAGSLTMLYKDSLEEYRVAGEVNRKLGYQRARRDMTHWARGKRRFIRRDELLSYLATSSPGSTVPNSGVGLENDFETGLSLASRGVERQGAAHIGAQGQGAAQLSQNAQQPLLAVQEMFELSRLDGSGRMDGGHNRMDSSGHNRYKRPPPSPSQDENMDSPSHKKSRHN